MTACTENSIIGGLIHLSSQSVCCGKMRMTIFNGDFVDLQAGPAHPRQARLQGINFTYQCIGLFHLPFLCPPADAATGYGP